VEQTVDLEDGSAYLEEPTDEEVTQALTALTDLQLLAALGEVERLRDMVVAEMDRRRVSPVR
jgi:hypothetical protein